MGPISLRPTAGSGWAPRKDDPSGSGPTTTAAHGTRYVFGAYDVHADRLRVRLRPKRTGSDMLAFMRQIRDSLPRPQRIYWIQDNLSANWTPDIRTFAAANNDRARPDPDLRQLPQPASNATSCRSAEFVVKNADYLDWDAFAFALARHVTYRNGHHRDQRLLDLERPPPNRCLTKAIPSQHFRDTALVVLR